MLSGARTALSSGHVVENAIGRPGDLGTPAALRCEGMAGAAERDGSKGECESGEGERGIGFFLRSRPQGDKEVRGGARGGGAAWVAHGGREGQVARGGAAAGAVDFAATCGACARRKWPMDQLSGCAWVSTVEPGSAQDRIKISLFSIFPLVQA
jgi:hypothetical protein